jgi:cation-transporting P-type ATPase E
MMETIQGLSEQEVLARRAAGQGNDAPLHTSRSYAQILRENVFTFINYVLFGLGTALILMGRVSDALVSVGVVLANTLVGVVQEVRAKRTLDRIAILTRPQATVIREGQERTIDPSEIVVGDILRIGPGDQVVVDGELVGNGRIEVDESLLTGESDLVDKQAGDPVYSGSFCVTGTALYEARKVGADSLAYEITEGARAFRRVYTPLQKQINLAIRLLLVIALYFQMLMLVTAAVRDITLVELVQMSVVIVGLIPNGLFLTIAAAYAIGAVRMVGQGALVQQANAVESLSNVDVLCLDKTGTLTANRIELHRIRPLPHTDEETVRHALAVYAASTPAGNRTTEALAEALPAAPQPILDEVPFSSERKWSALALASNPHPQTYVLGAPEMLQPYLDETAVAATADLLREWHAQGLRVLYFARAPYRENSFSRNGQTELPANLELLGVVSFSDVLRPDTRETLDSFAATGIELKVISGDNPDTVAALVRQAGIPTGDYLVSGPELERMSETERSQAAVEVSIFGRISPHQKEELVQLLQANGRFVAMIGDGVNDVLALKRANLGIAMESGSQAARGVADIILLQDAFSALPHAFQEGQRIINGMQGVLKLFLTRVLYAALLIITTAVAGGFPFTPKHNAMLTLWTVGIPAFALAAWARPGMPPHRDRLVRQLVHFVLPAALSLGTVALGVYLVYFLYAHEAFVVRELLVGRPAIPANPLIVAQAALTTFIIFCGLLLVPFVEPPSEGWVGGSELSEDKRPFRLAVLLGIAFAVVLSVPYLRSFFDLIPLTIADYFFLGSVAALWAAGLRYAWRARLMQRFLALDQGP